MERVFLDANVLVSAALKPESQLGTLWARADVRLLASPYVLAEARRNCAAPEFAVQLEALIAPLVVLPTEPADFAIEGDPGLPDKDRPILLAAIVAGSDWLLTGDMRHFGGCLGTRVHGVQIALPDEFLRRLQA
ncbi:MAG: PIN domain-containing protein [Actinobacteria bacterium]|nr:MAG: PIN domain-containing protein [Actinomycetota bacterium]